MAGAAWRTPGGPPSTASALLPQHFKLSTDPFFAEKVATLPQLKAVGRREKPEAWSEPSLLPPPFVEGGTARHHQPLCRPGRATDIAQCKPRHRHQEFLSFLRHIDANVPPELDVATTTALHEVRWSRYHLHFTPTYSSWLNQVEIWFNIITQKAILLLLGHPARRFRFTEPIFMWTATADSILQKIQRLCTLSLGQDTSSPWINPREHRERRGAGLARRLEGRIAPLFVRKATKSVAL